MTVTKVEKINIAFNNKELYDLGYTVYTFLKWQINTHIICLQNNSKEDYQRRERVFKEQNEKQLYMMLQFYALSGHLEAGLSLEKTLLKAVHDKEKVY